MEAELTGTLKETSNTNNLEVAEEANFDESITTEAKDSNETEIDIKDEQNTKAYEAAIKFLLKMLMKLSLKNPRLATIWKFILKDN